MKRVFADTNYYVAISNVSDQWHSMAKGFSKGFQGNFVSFEVMTELEITDALTTDHHFEQAGFRVLLKQESE